MVVVYGQLQKQQPISHCSKNIVRKEIRTRPIKWRDKASCRPVVASNNADLFAVRSSQVSHKIFVFAHATFKVIERDSMYLLLVCNDLFMINLINKHETISTTFLRVKKNAKLLHFPNSMEK